MIGTVFLAMLPAAIGFALSPLGLVEMILVLLSKRARTNSLVFLVAIVIPVFAVPFVGASGMDAGATTETERGTAEGVVLLVIALILAALAARNFTRRHDTSAPAILDKIADMGPLAVLLLAPGVTVLNPKNLVVLLGAGAAAGRYSPRQVPWPSRSACSLWWPRCRSSPPPATCSSAGRRPVPGSVRGGRGWSATTGASWPGCSVSSPWPWGLRQSRPCCEGPCTPFARRQPGHVSGEEPPGAGRSARRGGMRRRFARQVSSPSHPRAARPGNRRGRASRPRCRGRTAR